MLLPTANRPRGRFAPTTVDRLMDKLERELPPELVVDETLALLKEFSGYSSRKGFLVATRRAVDILWQIVSNDTAILPRCSK